MATTERPFDGSRTSSSIMSEDSSSAQVSEFMMSSFYLPVDILKNKDWKVESIRVMSGSWFASVFKPAANLHCLENYPLLAAARFVAVSKRRNKLTGNIYIVAKIWYGGEK